MKITDYKKQIIRENPDLAKKLEEDISHQVGKMIVEARLLKGLTQERLAQLVGTQQPSIARIENGASSQNLGFLKKVVNAMELTLLPPRIAELEELKEVVIDFGSGVYQITRSGDLALSQISVDALNFA